MKVLFFSILVTLFVPFAFGNGKGDIVVRDKTMVQRCVLWGADSKRIVAVGQPGGFNYAFDAINCSPVFAWTGGFLDFSGETDARGGKGCKPLGVKQTFGCSKIPLRIGIPDALPESLRFLGYRRNADTGAPTFLFTADGVSVAQHISSSSPGIVSISMEFSTGNTRKAFYRIDPTPHLQIVLGDGLRWSGPGVIEIPSGQKVAEFSIHLKATGKKFVRKVEQLTGEQIFKNYCSACHSVDGTKLIGPSFKGLWGREEVVVRNGAPETLTVDEHYLRESIVKPQAAIVKGYEAVPMADFSGLLTEDQIDSLIGYLKEMK